MTAERYGVRVRWMPYGKAEPRQEATPEQLLGLVKSAMEMGADHITIDACRCESKMCCLAHDIHASPHQGCILR